MSTIEEHKTEKRRGILQAARSCFIQHGFHATGMAEICQAAGMSPGNLYRYFPSKSALVRAIVDETRQQIMTVYEHLQTHPDPVEGLVNIIIHSIQHLCDSSECCLWIEILAEASRNEEIQQSCKLFDDQMRTILKKLLQQAIQSGQAAPDLHLDSGAIWLIALIDGALVRRATDPHVDLKSTMGTLATSIRRMLCAPAALTQ